MNKYAKWRKVVERDVFDPIIEVDFWTTSGFSLGLQTARRIHATLCRKKREHDAGGACGQCQKPTLGFRFNQATTLHHKLQRTAAALSSQDSQEVLARKMFKCCSHTRRSHPILAVGRTSNSSDMLAFVRGR